MTDAPHIVVCVPAAEQSFGDRIASPLTKRGLRVSVLNDVPPLHQAQQVAAICLVVGSYAQDRALIDGTAEVAAKAQRPFFPLLLRGEEGLPATITQTQWSDFTQHFWTGYLELLLALDMEHLSRWPYDPALFDGAVVLARTQNGLPHPDWQVYRAMLGRISRGRFTAKTALACVLVIIPTVLAWVINPANWLLYLLAGGLFFVAAGNNTRFRLFSYLKDGPIIVRRGGIGIHRRFAGCNRGKSGGRNCRCRRCWRLCEWLRTRDCTGGTRAGMSTD